MKKIKLLVLEEDAAEADYLIEVLASAGFDPEWNRVETGEAFAASLSADLDLIVADSDVPDFSCREALQVLKKRDLDLPLLIVSGSVREDDALAWVQEGAADYLPKEDRTRLEQAVESVLSRKERRAGDLQEEHKIRSLASFTDENPNPVLRVDPDGKILYANPASQPLLNFWESEVGGDLPAFLREQTQELFRQNRSSEIDIVDGRSTYLLTIAPVVDGPYINLFARDITERVQAQQRTEQLNLMLNMTIKELFSLNEISKEMAATLDANQIYRVIFEKVVSRFFRSPHFLVLHYDQEAGAIGCEFAIVDGIEQDPAQYAPFPLGEGPTSKTILTRRPRVVYFDDIRPDLEVGHSGGAARQETRSGLYVPMISGDSLIGVLNVQSYEQHAYDDADLPLLSTIANQAGVALANARFFAATQMHATELAEQEAKFRIIFQESPDAILVLDAAEGKILYHNHTTEQVLGYRPGALLGTHISELFVEDPRLGSERLSDLLEGQGSFIEPYEVLSADGSVCPMEITVALIPWENERAVMISLRDVTERKHAEELTQRQLRDLNVLQAVASTCNKAKSEEELYREITKILSTSLNSDIRGFEIIKDDSELVRTLTAERERLPALAGSQSRRPKKRTRQTAPLFLGMTPRLAENGLETQTFGPAVLFPMQLGDQNLGAIRAETDRIDAVRPEDERLLSTVARQVANAVSKLRLVEHTRRSNRELSLYYRVIAAAASFSLDVEKVLQTTCEELARAFDLPEATACLLNEGSRELKVVGEYQTLPDRRKLLGTSVPIEDLQGLESFLSRNQPVFLNQFEDQFDNLVELSLLSDRQIASLMTIPIQVRGRARGIFVLSDVEDREFSEQELRLASNATATVARVLENAQLHEESEARAQQFATLNEITNAALMTDEIETMLDAQADLVSAMLKADCVCIALWDPVRNLPVPTSASESIRNRYAKIPAQPGQDTLTEAVLQTGHWQIVEDAAQTELLSSDYAELLAGRTVLALPLFARETWLGAALIAMEGTYRFSSQEIDLAEQSAAQMALGIARYRTLEAARRRSAELETLRQANLSLISNLELQPLMEALLSQVYRLMEADRVSLFLYDGDELRFGAAYWDGAVQQRPMQEPDPDGLSYQVANQGLTLVASENDQKRRRFSSTQRNGIMVGLPIMREGHTVGVMNVGYDSSRHFDENDIRVMNMLADQTAIALQNAQMFEQNQKALEQTQELLEENASLFANLQDANQDLMNAYDATIQGWAKALELRDYETKGHSDRVSELTLRLATALGIEGDELVHIRRGALLHDVGKMGIPDEILFKPGKLSEEEWVIMKRHVDYAYEWLSGIPYLTPALDIPYCHHEKWDGSGYPRGLREEEIPLAARIFSVVDVWDALRSDRPYRDAWKKQKVIDYIRERSGIEFDPQIADTFLKIIQS